MKPITIEEAIECAAKAHRRQTDKQGEPYIFHPIRVMLCGLDDDEKMVGILHDVKEDNPEIWSFIRPYCPEHIIDAIDAISRQKGEDWDHYIERVRGNPLATKVKIYDLFDNLRPIKNPTPKDNERTSKYKRTVSYLMKSVYG